MKVKSGNRPNKSISKLKKELDKWFSLYIRLKYSNRGMCRCYTCHKPFHYKDLHCGHFIPRHILITRWDENNCRPQCVGCNIYGNGKFLDFEEHLVKDIGASSVMALKASRTRVFKINGSWYISTINHYKQAVLELQKEYGLSTVVIK